MRHFLKPVLNMYVLLNSIVWWGRGVLKRGLVFCIKSIDLGDVLIVGRRRIHQSKSWYYLGPFQTSEVELLAKIVFAYKPVTDFVKSFNLKMSDWFHKTLPINTFYVLLKKFVLKTSM